MNATIILNDIHKVEIKNNMVQYFELMGRRWVALGSPEKWSDDLIKYEFDL